MSLMERLGQALEQPSTGVTGGLMGRRPMQSSPMPQQQRGGGLLSFMERPGMREALLQISANTAPSLTPRGMFDNVGQAMAQGRDEARFVEDRQRQQQETARQRREEMRAQEQQRQLSSDLGQLLIERGANPEVVDLANRFALSGDTGMLDSLQQQVLGGSDPGEAYTLGANQIRYDANNNVVARGSGLLEEGQESEQARMDQVSSYETALDGINLIQDVMSDDALAAVTGPLQGMAIENNWPVTPDYPFNGVGAGERADIQAKLDQLQGEAFLQGFDRLRGGGQITEAEGQQARNAVARLQQTQTTEAYQQSLQELQTIMIRGALRAQGVEPTSQNVEAFRGQMESQQGQGVDVGQSALDAISQGADPAAVAQRLRDAGYDPSQFGINAPRSPQAPTQSTPGQMQDYWRAGGS